jgi:hypothetical protein
MPERYLSGADARFSDCFLAMNYRYRAGPGDKLEETQQTTVKNIHRDMFDAPVIERLDIIKTISEGVKVRKAGNFAETVILDLEQTKLENVNKAISQTTEYLIGTQVNQQDTVLRAVSGSKFDITDLVVKRPAVECNFGFVIVYNSPSGWDSDFLEDNNTRLSARNPNVRKIVDIRKDVIREEEFGINPQGDLRFDFTIEQDELTPDEITAVTNAVDGFASKAAQEDIDVRDLEVVQRNLTLI